VLETVAFASAAPSPVLKFSTMYLAVEQMITRIPMSNEATLAIDGLIDTLQCAALPDTEKERLLSAVGNLRGYHPFSTAFRTFATQNPSFPCVRGMPLQKLAADSIRLRNDIAHQVEAEVGRAEELASCLREFALLLVWSRNELPSITLDRPADSIVMTKFETRFI
jgi:hypothetical protein